MLYTGVNYLFYVCYIIYTGITSMQYIYVGVLAYERQEYTSSIIWNFVYIEILSHVRQLLLYVNNTLTI
jgi:hypothetical protein